MQVSNLNLPKLCHATVGQRVRLPDPLTGKPASEVFIVAALDKPGARPARPMMSHGLYDDQRPLHLVSLTTGVARPMPHLSSRAELMPMDEPATQQADTNAPTEVLVSIGKGKQPWEGDLEFALDLTDPAAVHDVLVRLSSTGAKVVGVQAVDTAARDAADARRQAIVQKVLSHLNFGAKKPMVEISGYGFLVATQPKTGAGVFVIDGNFSRAEFKACMAEIALAGLESNRMYVFARLGLYSGPCISFTKFDEIGIDS